MSTSSIVYATDKKHTKVDFPEARIYEETLNILLYENRDEPDLELIQATSSRVAAVGASSRSSHASDEEEDGIRKLSISSTPNMRVDVPSGSNRDIDSHSVYSSVTRNLERMRSKKS